VPKGRRSDLHDAGGSAQLLHRLRDHPCLSSHPCPLSGGLSLGRVVRCPISSHQLGIPSRYPASVGNCPVAWYHMRQACSRNERALGRSAQTRPHSRRHGSRVAERGNEDAASPVGSYHR
jgi:hypothetical protein